ncbi:hydroxymethylbutenyl pyrophosphate reductase [Hydrogenobacter thermophilus TK-6]|uniref:4-hydroxy-3-methylbut-2-enyl diphosphate reductase n=1 Tax=Hydrogenobacter thermophilus (strain DSM 6534 / IAM 12695 / TK-6) TaxID=608538 RepID=D3DIN9_HYDTT|nr:4-hydroxy-3-methylbut-2-enyl diphosphate reductase [Hydrogenobacter thermophilus]ADO45617.1 hydroxymethylbutenyl pyrophosphate reductase [Hydrogenobacter thermophilus TK-6]BAI69691.1 4-hydroxy-3-methylbut-2-enyl diphosphate reductase [Hydrogenobacter thermophilus TK-6]
MVEIVVAEHAGFCFGVKRAISIAEQSSELSKQGKRVFTMGPLIHNPQEVERLRKKGVELLYTEDALKSGDTVIIRSHGIPPKKERQLKELGLNVMDATCPYVKAVHDAVVKLSQEGYFVVLVGEKSHPEVIGTLGYLEESGGKGTVVESFDDLKAVLGKDKVGIVAQTTQNEQFFKEVVGEIAIWAKEVKVINTICNATSERQEDVYKLAPEVDVMIIIGGKNSGNTRRLYEISRSLNLNSYHIETADDIKPEWFIGVKRVGITAGASTPDWIINSVVERIREVSKEEQNEYSRTCREGAG